VFKADIDQALMGAGCLRFPEVRPQVLKRWAMKTESQFYLDRAARCLDMAEHVDKKYREDLIQIARGWVRLAEEESVPEEPSAMELGNSSVLLAG
jgi:hypothetical protein